MPSSSGRYGGGGGGGGEERGGGGKLRKPPPRRPPSTPYDRPPSNQSQAASQRPDGGWLSKLVDPACRLIAGGATRIFPSIFSKSSSSAEDHDNEDTEIDEEANYDMEGSSLNFGISEATGGTNPRKGEAKLNCSSDFDPLAQENTNNLPQGSEFSKIEQMVKARTFSRDEINRLTEILSSRVADLSNVDSEEKKLNMALKREGKGVVLVRENPRASTEEKKGGLDGARVDSLITLPHLL
ncbi:nuclear pore complex protein NUP1-like [Actinidia eriantha]|uniref:nuclear pore complex protein NUP1-like n=1 Tax=Actinidia eriantha TaxID=165200 RepID=UPI0025833495|nr:nuclear pore complex protein NUP1-like [Actinidia eriantha]